jgi:hypothetical protein
MEKTSYLSNLWGEFGATAFWAVASEGRTLLNGWCAIPRCYAKPTP